MFHSAQTVEDAIDELARWADSLPGEFTIDVTDFTDATVIEVTGTLISSGLGLRVWLHVASNLEVEQYRFHVQHPDGRLLWRHDRHPGHEEAAGMRGPEHVHRRRGGVEVRRPDSPVDLLSIREALIQANLEHAQ